MDFNKKLLCALFFITTYPTVTSAIDITPELGVSYRSFTYTINSQKYIEDTFPSLRYGLTAVQNKLYLNIYGENSFLTGEKTAINVTEAEDFAMIKRKDAALSLGYAYTPNLSFFGGYKWGKTKITTEQEGENSFLIDAVNHEHTTSGPFLGANFVIRLDRVNISSNFAYSILDGSLESNDPRDNSQSHSDYNGNGYSASVALTGKLAKDLVYTTSFEVQRYTYEENHSDKKIKEKQSSFRFSVKYIF